MKKMTLMVLLLIATMTSAQTPWKTYSVPGRHYTVDFPGNPVEQEPTKTSGGDNLRIFKKDDGPATFELMILTTSNLRATTEEDITRMASNLRMCGDTSAVNHITYRLDEVEFPAVSFTNDCTEVNMMSDTVLVAVGSDVIELHWLYSTGDLKGEDVDPATERMRHFFNSLKMVRQ
jgi:hypothetical protein